MLHPDLRLLERHLPQARVVYALLPPHIPQRFESLTPRGAIGVSFSPHRLAARQYDTAPVRQTDIGAGDAFVTTSADLRWLDVAEPAEALEIHLAHGELARVANELGASRHAELPDVEGRLDAVVWSAAATLRGALRGGAHIDGIALDELMDRLCAHVLRRYGGLADKHPPSGQLDARRLSRVVARVEAGLGEPLRLQDLAHEAALSRHHFARAFRATTGMPPHRFVTMRRMDRARRLLHADPGMDILSLAEAVGYASVPHFRQAFVAAFGATPSRLRHEVTAFRGTRLVSWD